MSGTSNRARRVDELERKVQGLDAKLELLIAAAHPPTPHSSTPRKVVGPYQRPAQEVAFPAPRQLRQEQNEGGYVDLIIQQERFRPPTVEGKTHLAPDIFTESLLPKPYMYVSREGVSTLKQKLDIRSSLSQMEYINATLMLVNDKRACSSIERDGILRHLQDVTHDVMVRPWENVRRWSQYVWDAVERRELSWADSQQIHNHRVTIAINGSGSGRSAHPVMDNNQRSNKQELICRSFNTRAGCRQRSHHDEGQVRLLHICAFCDSLRRHCPGHNVVGCNNKSWTPGPPRPLMAQGQTSTVSKQGSRPDQLPWRQQQQPAPPSYNYYSQAPKNAM